MRYTKADLLTWGKEHHYPQLVLIEGIRGQGDYVKHGELHWRRMARNKARRDLAWQRIQMWNARMQERIA